jgi:hypothetical protein
MQAHAHPLPADSTLAGPALYAMTSAWWLVQTLATYGPSWEALGPILSTPSGGIGDQGYVATRRNASARSADRLAFARSLQAPHVKMTDCSMS